MGFRWGSFITAWEDRLVSLPPTIQRNPQGLQCFTDDIENTKLATWVTKQRTQYRMHLEGRDLDHSFHVHTLMESLGLSGNLPSAEGKGYQRDQATMLPLSVHLRGL
jgi:hypothetical protein